MTVANSPVQLFIFGIFEHKWGTRKHIGDLKKYSWCIPVQKEIKPIIWGAAITPEPWNRQQCWFIFEDPNVRVARLSKPRDNYSAHHHHSVLSIPNKIAVYWSRGPSHQWIVTRKYSPMNMAIASTAGSLLSVYRLRSCWIVSAHVRMYYILQIHKIWKARQAITNGFVSQPAR